MLQQRALSKYHSPVYGQTPAAVTNVKGRQYLGREAPVTGRNGV